MSFNNSTALCENAYFYTIITSLIWRIILEYEGALYKLKLKLIKVLLNLCSAAGYLALKKYHDLQMCTRPTCRGILGDGIRNKKNSGRKYFFSNLQTSKYRLFLKKNINAPRLDISLKKITRPSNLLTTYLLRYSRRKDS